jgi:hypothetical protein
MNFLLQPYPFDHKGRYLIINTLLMIVVGFCFDYFLIPFERDFDEHLYSYWVITLAHVAVAASIYFVVMFIISVFVMEDEWKIYKEILSLAFLLLCIGIGEFLIREFIYDNPNDFAFFYLREEISHAYLSGSVIIAIVININYHRKRLANSKLAAKINLPVTEPVSIPQLLSIKAGIVSDNFEIDPTHIICVKSDGNYLEFFVNEKAGIKKHLKRMTLQSAMDQLRDFDTIIKTHRTFLINTHFMETVEGNAQGYQITLRHLDFKVPVSRSHLEHFNSLTA